MALEKEDYKAATQILKQMANGISMYEVIKRADEFGLNAPKAEVSVKDSEFKITFN